MPPLPIDPNKVLRNLKELRELTSDEHGAQRVAWTPTWSKARRWLVGKLSELPVEHHVDAAGNLWVTLRGATNRTVLLGSHLDSVPNGGWLDGCLGVIVGLEMLTAASIAYRGEPPCTLKLVDWADEEGARFGRSLFGSSAFAGTQTIEADRQRKDHNGETMEAVLGAWGIDLDRIGDAATERANLEAYLELHIEQGPVLERQNRPLGVVLGTKGVERWNISFQGQEAHAGSTPMRERRDAFAACARFALALRKVALSHSESVVTVGSVKTFPGIVTAVVGKCDATLDMRDLDEIVLSRMLSEAQSLGQQIAAEERCSISWSKIWSIEPIRFDSTLISLCEQAIEQTTGTCGHLPSGPLHDAAEVARLGIPTVMMFVQSLNGLSHNSDEDTKVGHLELAVSALGLLTEKTMLRISGSQ